MHYDIDSLIFDEHNEEEMWRHRVRAIEVDQVLSNRPKFYRNRKGRSSTVIMVGPTDGGRMLTVPLAPTPVDGLWRPATAWDSKPGEITRYRGGR